MSPPFQKVVEAGHKDSRIDKDGEYNPPPPPPSSRSPDAISNDIFNGRSCLPDLSLDLQQLRHHLCLRNAAAID